MSIKPFTMEEVDEEIMQIVLQQTTEPGKSSGPPSIIKSMIDRVKAKRNSNNGNADNQTK